MGIDIVTYRVRIGSFANKGHRHIFHGTDIDYRPCVNSSDIAYRALAVSLFVMMYMCYHHCLVTASHSAVSLPMPNKDNCGFQQTAMLQHRICLLQGTSIYQETEFVSSPCAISGLVANYVANIAQRLLLLSSDVELNPGPNDLDVKLDNLLQAVAASERRMFSEMKLSENRLMDEFNAIRINIASILSDVDLLKHENLKIGQDLHSLHSKQAATTDIVVSNECRVTDIESTLEVMQLDIDALHDEIGSKDDTIAALSNEIEELKRNHISNNMRVFGLKVDATNYQDQLKSIFINKVLKVANPGINWSEDDIKYVKVISSNDATKESLLIVTFRFDDDKFRVYEGRALLRTSSIRVGDDLTFKQRETLRSIHKLGKTGYFFKGKLQVKDKPIEPNDSRTFKSHTQPAVTDVLPGTEHANTPMEAQQ
ncbi:hypothetical protein DPMN_070801 [Dreissena polymorpha]|uniref:Uncharacterized protein n=1 Tax=Dreissena polymorpha TaxID=45954 RepID=A0A9D3Z5U1_DREPO|nr:hypothetical protein DPMN_070801 [Dreissena polymorpha]